jgi:hypothetical protein
MGHGINSITERIKLQWQTSSTELINATPICDILKFSKNINAFTEQGGVPLLASRTYHKL